MNESINDEGVCRLAPATPGLLNMGKVINIASSVTSLVLKLTYEIEDCLLLEKAKRVSLLNI